jgi:hypothetical protein
MSDVRDIFDRKAQRCRLAAVLMGPQRPGVGRLVRRVVRAPLPDPPDAREQLTWELRAQRRACRLRLMRASWAERLRAWRPERDARADEQPQRQTQVQRRVARQEQPDEVREPQRAPRLERPRSLPLRLTMARGRPDARRASISPQQPWRLCPLRQRLPAPPSRGNAYAPAPRGNCRSSSSASSSRSRRFPEGTRSGLWP